MEQVYFSLAECRAAQECDGAPLFVLGFTLLSSVVVSVGYVVAWIVDDG